MGRHVNSETGVVFSVDDSKDDRYKVGHEPADEPKKAASSAKSSSASKSGK